MKHEWWNSTTAHHLVLYDCEFRFHRRIKWSKKCHKSEGNGKAYNQRIRGAERSRQRFNQWLVIIGLWYVRTCITSFFSSHSVRCALVVSSSGCHQTYGCLLNRSHSFETPILFCHSAFSQLCTLNSFVL